jgi:hypothetical protein
VLSGSRAEEAAVGLGVSVADFGTVAECKGTLCDDRESFDSALASALPS